MKFNQLDFELHVRDILDDCKTETDLEYISDVMRSIVEGVADEKMFELEEEE